MSRLVSRVFSVTNAFAELRIFSFLDHGIQIVPRCHLASCIVCVPRLAGRCNARKIVLFSMLVCAQLRTSSHYVDSKPCLKSS